MLLEIIVLKNLIYIAESQKSGIILIEVKSFNKALLFLRNIIVNNATGLKGKGFLNIFVYNDEIVFINVNKIILYKMNADFH